MKKKKGKQLAKVRKCLFITQRRRSMRGNKIKGPQDLLISFQEQNTHCYAFAREHLRETRRENLVPANKGTSRFRDSIRCTHSGASVLHTAHVHKWR